MVARKCVCMYLCMVECVIVFVCVYKSKPGKYLPFNRYDIETIRTTELNSKVFKQSM